MIDTEVARTFDRRSALFLSAGAVLTSVLILRMLQMQVFSYRTYKRKSEGNLFRVQLDIAPRGRILSSKKIPISRDKKIYRIYIVPEEVRDMDELLSAAASDLKLSARSVEKIRATIRKQPRFQPVLISDNSEWSALAKLQARNLAGLHVSGGFGRVYEMGPAGAQIFGYVGTPKRAIAGAPFMTVGTAGMERTFEDKLSGTPGRTVMTTNAVGRVTGTDAAQSTAPIPGHDIHTTVRDDVQRAMYDALTAAGPGCGVALDIATGDILAMVSTPSFDPNKFNDSDADKYIASLRSDIGKPFMNKTIEGLYPPGSTFKIVVALAALESGAVNPNEKISCPGHWDYGDRRYHCWKSTGHGAVDLAGALAHSCDIYFYQIALRIGIDAIRAMALKLGLGEKYMDDILFREMPGVIPDRKWKEKHIGYNWVHGDTIISGIGQGFVLTNCLQLATMTARAVSNRRVVPRLIYGAAPNFESLNLQQKNIDYVMRGLERVTRPGGTAAGAAINVRGARMGGKTGTAQVRSISKAERESGVLTNEQLKWYMRNHGLFVGYAPTTNPRYAVAIITEHSGGSTQASTAAAAVMKTLLNGDK